MSPSSELSDRYVKRHLYAPTHFAAVDAGPGFTSEVEAEIRALLEDRLTPSRSNPTISADHSRVIVRNIDYRSLLELVLRTSCAADVSLGVAHGHAENEEQLAGLLSRIEWKLFFRPDAKVLIRANSYASRLYHTGILSDSATEALERTGCAVSSDAATADHVLSLTLRHDRLQASISLAGRPLWQRGYRAELEAVAPLREDLAQAAIRRALNAFARPAAGSPEAFDLLLVPFAGSGTLAFESIIAWYQVPPFLFGDAGSPRFAFERFNVGSPPSVDWLKRKLRSLLQTRLTRHLHTVMIDSYAPACDACTRNWSRFSEAIFASPGGSSDTTLRENPGPVQLTAEVRREDVLLQDWSRYVGPDTKSLFIPMNPPYGRRLRAGEVASLYKRIGRRVEELVAPRNEEDVAVRQHRLRVCGFILCADEATWSAFLNAVPSYHCVTSHFTQGGLDIRLCIFES
ncbi:MAG TPA: hypothetical protein VMW73_11585 [Spirochaetia bacterium]|nr:hypothetical protein [Spirochaetia bacterium]